MNDSELDKILLSAGNDPPLPPGFRRQVWLRIESSSARNPGLARWFERILSPLTKPAVAATAVLTMTALGLGLGAGLTPDAADQKEAYVQSVSPFASLHDQ